MSEHVESTRAAVRRVANEILAEGGLPSGREIRARIGTGSFNTIHSELKLWAQDAAQVLQLPAIPASMRDFVLALWRQAVTDAGANYLPQLEAQAEQLQELEAQNRQLREELQRAGTVHQAQLEDAQAATDEARHTIEVLSGQNAEQKAMLSQQQMLSDELRIQVEQATKAAENAKWFFQEESRKVADQFQALEVRLLNDADAAKQAAKQQVDALQATLRREQATAAQRQTEAARQIDELKQRIYLQDQRLETITLQNSKLQVELTQARGAAQHVLQENTLLRDTNATLKTLIDGMQMSAGAQSEGQ